MQIGLWSHPRRRGRVAWPTAASEGEDARLPGGACMAAVWPPTVRCETPSFPHRISKAWQSRRRPPRR